ncbi:MAG: isocitrate/isopropylmalate dehydrogenase family protein [Nitrososphaeria archaeon]
MSYKIAWIQGDGIGPEISKAALKVLKVLQAKFSLNLELSFYQAGDRCKASLGTPLPDSTVDGIRQADATLKGPVGESAADVIVRLRRMLDLYANIRPAKNYEKHPYFHDIDLIIVRENTEDLYSGIEFEVDGGAVALRIITEKASQRIAEVAAKLALTRRRKVTIVHKANVMKKTCGLFTKKVKEELAKHPELIVNEAYVDAASMALIRNPETFDIIVTTNLFGDILSDEAAQVAGGLGMAASANLGTSMAIFEPVHGSAPDIAGKGIANPYSMILSCKMMFDWLYSRKGDRRLSNASEEIEQACTRALKLNLKTPDLGGTLTTDQVAEKICDLISGRG